MIAENISLLNERIQRACDAAGRNPAEITLIGVTKTVGPGAVISAKNAGIINFGENKAQDLRDKAAALPEDIIWHFIGRLQKNKVKYAVEYASYIHSVDSAGLAEAVEAEAQKKNKTVRVLIEVKTSDEASKTGISGSQELDAVLKVCRDAKHIELAGLMTIAPFTDDEKLVRASFRKLAGIRKDIAGSGSELPHLSMGMSGDFETAIEEGATMIRVGTAIFGERIYSI